MQTTTIKDLLVKPEVNTQYNLSGWVRNKRSSKSVTFISLNDGSCFDDIQIVFETEKYEESLKKINTGCSIYILGTLVQSSGSGQSYELIPEEINPNSYLPYAVPGLEIILSVIYPKPILVLLK